MQQQRKLFFYKDYFRNFYSAQSQKVKNKILWTLRIVEEVKRIPESYFKYLEGTDGLYEIRVQIGNDIFRIFSFLDEGNLVVIGHGFQKKTQKTPRKEIIKAQKIKAAYYEEKKSHQP